MKSLLVVTIILLSFSLSAQQRYSDIYRPFNKFPCSQNLVSQIGEGIDTLVHVESIIYIYMSYDSVMKKLQLLSHCISMPINDQEGVRKKLSTYLTEVFQNMEITNSCNFSDSEVLVLPIVSKNQNVDRWTTHQNNPILSRFESRLFHNALLNAFGNNLLPIFYIKRSNFTYPGR